MAMDLFSTISDAVFGMKQYVWSIESIEDGIAFGKKVLSCCHLCRPFKRAMSNDFLHRLQMAVVKADLAEIESVAKPYMREQLKGTLSYSYTLTTSRVSNSLSLFRNSSNRRGQVQHVEKNSGCSIGQRVYHGWRAHERDIHVG